MANFAVDKSFNKDSLDFKSSVGGKRSWEGWIIYVALKG